MTDITAAPGAGLRAAADSRPATFAARIDSCEWRDSGNGRDLTLTGHAAVFNEWSEPLDTWAGVFRERIAPGAFRDVLATAPDVRALFNHDSNFVLGRTRSGTLELSEDSTGLRVWARVPPTTWAADLRESMGRGDIDQMSFAFTVAEDEWREDHDTEEVWRTITRVDELFDVSVVTYPAYPQTDAAIRSLVVAKSAGLINPRVAQTPDEGDSAGAETVAPAQPVGGMHVARLRARARASVLIHEL